MYSLRSFILFWVNAELRTMKAGWALLTLFLAASVSAQDISHFIQTISVDEGLSQSSVNSIFQDQQGFLWIGTANGLNRYDGKQINVFKIPVNINEPSNANLIRGRIAEDINGNIWYSSENGLYMFNRNKFRVEKKYDFVRNKLDGSDYHLVFINSKQIVWLYSLANGFASYTISSAKFEAVPRQYPLRNTRLVSGNYEVENGRVWFVLHRNDGIYSFDTQTQKIAHHLAKEDLRFIRFGRKGHYLVGPQSIQYFDSATAQVRLLAKFPFDLSAVRDVIEDKFGRLWVATINHRLWVYDLQKNSLSEFITENFSGSLLSPTLFFIDRTQNLWIGTNDAGINRINLKSPSFHLLTAHTLKTSTLYVKSVVEDAKGQVWVLSLNNRIHLFDPKKYKALENEWVNRINADHPLSVNQDEDGNTWVGGNDFIYIIDSLGKVKSYPNFLHKFDKTTRIFKIKRLLNSQTVIATNFGLVFLNGKMPDQGHFSTQQSSLHGIDFAETDDESLWVATNSNGIFKNVHNKNGEYIQQKNFFPNLYIYLIHQDPLNRELLWLASDKGLIRFNRITYNYRLYSEKDGMSNAHVYNILEDSKNYLWCGTLGGIVRFNKITQQFSNYTVTDGLQNNEFNSRAFFKGRSGNFYFGGIKGLNWFVPEAIDVDSTETSASLSEVLVNDFRLSDSVLRSEKIFLSYFQNDLSLRFSVFDFSKPQSNKIRCRLSGWDKKPVVSHSLQIAYNNILPGNYTLIYEASTGNNYWSKEKKIAVIIDPPFWQRWWFYSLVAILLVAILGLAIWFFVRQRYKMRIAELEKQNAIERERRRISMEIHDDVGANLTHISLISEAAKHHSEKEKALDQIARTSRQVVSSMGEIIWSLNPDNKTFEQLMSYLRDQLHNLLESSGIDYRIDLPECGEYKISNTVKRNLILLVKEAANNAVRHSGASRIEITGQLQGSFFEIGITDDGCGFNHNNGQAGNGLKNAKIRAKEIHGELTIDSVIGAGTKIIFKIPINEKPYH